ncbi:hypothetical protein NLI96_g8131 [Meripilus lineatus]|uniref:Uncharacterized protein n=1 Tax=Meripilus lineatus TaxID=2056292 RepID=A0AAD5UXX4_9APHY|nr:hypothetical protein NLI96_g8131 [Physisporinus lineatus]
MFSSSNPSSSSLLSVASTTPLNPSSKSQKDYLSAFGALQSSYGFCGAAPTVSRPHSSKSTSRSSRFAEPSKSTPDTHTSSKNFEEAFGKLVSSYGFASPVKSGKPKTR